MRYILDDNGAPVREDDLHRWALWYEANSEKRIVAQEDIGDSKVSTVFLGLDHAFGGATPLLWETMVFNGPMDGDCDRCGGVREEAEKMHAAMVAKVRAAQ